MLIKIKIKIQYNIYSFTTHSPPATFRTIALAWVKVGRVFASSSQQLLIILSIGMPNSVVSGSLGRNGIDSPFLIRLTTSNEQTVQQCSADQSLEQQNEGSQKVPTSSDLNPFLNLRNMLL